MMIDDEKNFATFFKPQFNASQLGMLCGNVKPKTEVNFVAKFKPFSNVKAKLLMSSSSTASSIASSAAAQPLSQSSLSAAAQSLSQSSSSAAARSSSPTTTPSSSSSTNVSFSGNQLESLLDAPSLTPIKKSGVVLTPDEKSFIRAKLNETIKSQLTTFDDKELIRKTNENQIKLNEQNEIITKFSQLKLIDGSSDDGSNKDDYETADSDEESFRHLNNQMRENKFKLVLASLESDRSKFLAQNRYVSCERGKLYEKSIIEKINKLDQMNFVKPMQSIYKDFGLYNICGNLDGVDKSKETIIEVKTRKNFDIDKKTITRREKIQVLVYMNLTQTKTCLFIESGPNGELKKTTIDYNEKEIDKVLSTLERFVQKYRKMSAKEFKELYLRYNRI